MVDVYPLLQMITNISAFIPLTPWETCAVDLVTRNHPSSVYFFCKSSSSCPRRDFYQQMQVPMQTVFQTRTDRLPRFNKSDLVFLVVNEDDVIWNNETVHKYRLGGKADFKLIVVANMGDSNDSVRMEDFFQAMWKSGIVYSAVLLKNSAVIFTYIPFKSTESCENTGPVSLGECREAVDRVFDPLHKVHNLNNCPIRLTVSDDKPFLSFPMEGLYKNMLLEMGHRMNFTVEPVKSRDTRIGGSCGADELIGVRGEVAEGRAHMAVGQFHRKECSQLEYIGLPFMQCVSWCTPIVSGRANVLDFLVGQFQANVWIAIATTIFILVISVALLCFLSQEPYSGSSAMNLALVIFAQVPRIGFRADSPRMILAVWLCASVVIRAAYESESKSRTTMPIGSYIIRDQKDLASTKLKLCTTPSNLGVLNFSEEPVMQQLYNKTGICKEITYEALVKAAREKNMAVFISDLRCSVTSSIISTEATLLYSYTGGCFKTSQVTPITTLPTFPFNERWADILQRFTEAGLIHKWLDIQTLRRHDGGAHPYSLDHLVPSLLVLALGWVVGFIAFLVEKAICSYRNLRVFVYT